MIDPLEHETRAERVVRKIIKTQTAVVCECKLDVVDILRSKRGVHKERDDLCICKLSIIKCQLKVSLETRRYGGLDKHAERSRFVAYAVECPE